MAFDYNGFTTGVLGYKLRKDFLGEGLHYRETEVYNYEIYARPTQNSSAPFGEIEANIKSYFSTITGDLTVKVVEAPADYHFPNDHVRLGKFNVEVEIKKPLTTVQLDSYHSELATNRYKGLNSTFFSTYGTWFENFSEDFTFETKDGGVKVYGHSLNFSLLSGGKPKAQEIATAIFGEDKNTELGVNVYPNGVVLANTDNYVNYYGESYDLIRNAFNFSKRREVLPFTSSTYRYDLSHSITQKNDGFIDVSEKGTINGFANFSQAKAGYDALFPNAYTRCNDYYNNYKAVIADVTVGDSLVNLPILSTKTFNKLANSVDYEVGFTNDQNYNATRQTSLEKVTEIERTEENFINISQRYNYSLIRTPISGGSDAEFVTSLALADTESAAEVPTLYSNSPFYDAKRPNMKRLRINASTPTRRKGFQISFNYTNNPIYFVTLDSVTYAILEYKVSDTKPADMVTEYKVINRPTKMSIVSYAYQTERGTKNVSISARLQRDTVNAFTSPRSTIASNLLSLYKYAVGKALEDFKGINILAMSYYLSDVKYSINSESEITMDIGITYAVKKYTG